MMQFLSEGPAKPRMFEFAARMTRLAANDQVSRLHEDLLRIGARSSPKLAKMLAAMETVGSA